MFKFFGRENEIDRVFKLWSLSEGKTVILKGRRRIGKSSLMDAFAEKSDCYQSKNTYLKFEGIQPEDPKKMNKSGLDLQQKQMDHLYTQLKIMFKINPQKKINDWSYFFDELAKKVPKNTRVIISFDEISWICEGDDNLFLSKLKIFLDNMKKRNDLMTFLCGSSSVWIDKYIIKSTAFVGRRDDSITVPELELQEISKFWENKPSVSNKDKLKSILVTGGIPKYLELVLAGDSAENNIKRLCFNKGSFLQEEFETLFQDSFEKRSKYHKQILYSLKKKPRSFSEIAEDVVSLNKKSKLTAEELSVNLGGYLSELELSGFITKEIMYKIGGGLSKFTLYRLSDCYTRFYLYYIEPKKGLIERDHYKFNKTLDFLPQYETIMGYQFENLVLNNKKIIKEKLELDTIKTFGPYRQYKNLKQEACQIDLLVEDNFQTLYLCEMKFKKKITKKVISEVKQKIKKLKIPKGYSIRPILIYSGILTEDVESSDFFHKMINLEDSLK